MEKLPVPTEAVQAGFGNSLAFEFMQRQAKMLASSDLVPDQFCIAKTRDAAEMNRKIANTMIALEMAYRIGASPMSVLQNLYIVHGKPSWSSTFIIAAINGCGRFSSMAFEMSGEGDSRSCVAYATDKSTGIRLDSPPISIQMAKDEGWYGKSGSKWRNMPELMLRYRAATLFGRLYAPEILMGMRAAEELEDIEDAHTKKVNIMDKFKELEVATELEAVEPEVVEEPAAPVEVEETGVLQEVYVLLDTLSKQRGDSPDDVIDDITKGKVGCQQDLVDKDDEYLTKLKTTIEKLVAA